MFSRPFLKNIPLKKKEEEMTRLKTTLIYATN